MPPETSTNSGEKSYDSGSFFGNLLDKGLQFGGQVLQFDWMKHQYNTEAALAGQYAAANQNQRAAERQDLNTMRTDNLVKYGLMAVVGVVAAVALMKAVK